MSGEGPESIPTSADPRSRRPVKKRALTPVSAQAATVEALFAKPDQEIRIPPAGGARPRHAPAPPEIVTNVQGSSAGAGSGEFHVYKASRRREYERLRIMDEEVEKERAAEEFEKSREEKARVDDEKTRRNREKREKLKARKEKTKKQKGKGNGDVNGRSVGVGGGGGGGGGIKARVVKSEDATRTDGAEADGKGEDTRDTLASQAPAEDAPGLIIQDDD